jgi:hypothetical protein
MHSRAVIHPLKGEEIVYRCDSVGISGGDHDLTATGQITFGVGDLRSKLLHPGGARHVRHRVNEARDRKISARERGCDGPQVRPNGRFTEGVGLLSLEYDPSAGRKWFKDVRRCVLIHAHRGLAPLLKCGKSRVGASRLFARSAGDQRRNWYDKKPGAHS